MVRECKYLLIFIAVLMMVSTATLGGEPTQDRESIELVPVSLNSHSSLDESTPWWNTTYYYRRHVNITDQYNTPRVDVPFHLNLEFDNNTCYKDSIRIVDQNGNEVPSQVYKQTYWEDTDYLKTASVFWYANVPKQSTATYWIYYSSLKTIEPAVYSPVVWFARTIGTLSGKFGPNYWSFRGDWYNVTMYNAAGGKMTNGAHKMADGSWNWNWGTNQGSMHWNPDGLGGGATSNIAPISGTTFVNVNGPLFINYTTQVPFGSYAKMNVTYTFYRWGWTFRTYILYSGTISGSGRTDEWVFYPYTTIEAIKVDEDLTQTYYPNWVQNSNVGKPAGFGWWNTNGISHGTVRISHNSWNTNPSYPNDYDKYYYRWLDQSAYEYWDTVIPTIYAIPGTVLEETCAFAVWNGAEGRDGYMRVFNATSPFISLQRSLSGVSSYSFRIRVQDLGGTRISGANVTLLNATSGVRLYKLTGEPYTALTNADGEVIFTGLMNKTYRIVVWSNTASWLDEESGSTGLNVTWAENRAATGPFTPVSVTLNMASITLTLRDLMGDLVGTQGPEILQARVYNGSDPDPSAWKYMDYELASGSGTVTFTRLPRCDWVFMFFYSNADTGHTYQWKDFREYASYRIPRTEITGDLQRSWVLPLVTVDFNVKAYDLSNVANAYVLLSKKGTGDPYPPDGTSSRYNVTHYTDATGNVRFYRILNGTWNIFLYKYDDFGQLAYNSTEQLSNIQGYSSRNLLIPLTSLRVLVQDTSGYRVPGAQVNVSISSQYLVTAYTDTSGWCNFTYIRASTSYTVVVSKSWYTSPSQAVYAGRNFYQYNVIQFQGLTYNGLYTELNCSVSSLSVTYGAIIQIQVGWFNRTGTASNYVDTPLSNYAQGWINFTIIHDGIVVARGSWNGTGYYLITYMSGINFQATIGTITLNLDTSSIPYLIKFEAHAPGYSDPQPLVVPLVVSVSQTTALGPTQRSVYWMDGVVLYYSLYATQYGYNLTGLSYYNYSIYTSPEYTPASRISFGTLQYVGNGVYRFSNALLNASDVGTYYVLIWLYKHNYVNRTVSLRVVINPVATVLNWVTQPVNYTWGAGPQSVTLILWDTVHGVPITGSNSVTIYWIDQTTMKTVLVVQSSSLTYAYSSTVVGAGSWKLRVVVSNPNCLPSETVSNLFVVQPRPTEVVLTTDDSVTVLWGSQYATFGFIYRHTDPVSVIVGARLISINWSGEVILTDNGDGTYQLRLLPVGVARNQTVVFTVWIANRTSASQSVTVRVLIPLHADALGGSSPQSPVREYYTRQFVLRVVVGDQSNQSAFVSGVVVRFVFPAAGLDGYMVENSTGGYYWVSFAASVVSGAGLYEIWIYASRIGCSPASTKIFIEVVATPTQATAENQVLTVYYADTFLLNYTWTITIDDLAGISNPDSITVTLWRGSQLIGTYPGTINEVSPGRYQFVVSTASLGMSALHPLYPTVYYFVITMSKMGYQDPLAATVVVLVLQTPTKMIAEAVAPVTWADDLVVRVTLWDLIHGTPVWTGAVVTFVHGSFSAQMTSLNNGTFILVADSSMAFSAMQDWQTAEITYTLPNYVDGKITVQVLVQPRPAHIIVIDPPQSSYTYGDSFAIRLQVAVNQTMALLQDCTLRYYWSGHPTIGGALPFSGSWYQGSIDTGRVPAGNYSLVVEATRGNYTIRSLAFLIEVRPLKATLTSSDGLIVHAIYGAEYSRQIRLSYTYGGVPIPGALVTLYWAGRLLSTTMTDGEYVFVFNPSEDTSLTVPGQCNLIFTASKTNYSTETLIIVLRLSAATAVQGGPYRVEYEQTLQLEFRYWDIVNDQAVPGATVYYRIGDGPLVPVTLTQFDGEKYTVLIPASEIGQVRPDPYLIYIIASAYGYQNWTQMATGNAIVVYVDPPTINIMGIIRVPRDTLVMVLLMTASFAAIVVGYRAVKSWKVPFHIKQIDRALKDIESGRKARIAETKTMGEAISELLAPGLARLEITAPVLEEAPPAPTEEAVEELFDELEALESVEAPEEGEGLTEDEFGSILAEELKQVKAEPSTMPPEETPAEQEVTPKKEQQEKSDVREEKESREEAEVDHTEDSERKDGHDSGTGTDGTSDSQHTTEASAEPSDETPPNAELTGPGESPPTDGPRSSSDDVSTNDISDEPNMIDGDDSDAERSKDGE
ncbi:MAG: hypothetical protein QXS20_04185 [Candidatus Thorarchaeota archaeon]